MTKIVSLTADALGKLGQHTKEAALLEQLLQSRIYCRARRGTWSLRLTLLYERYLDRKDDAIDFCRKALADEDISLGNTINRFCLKNSNTVERKEELFKKLDRLLSGKTKKRKRLSKKDGSDLDTEDEKEMKRNNFIEITIYGNFMLLKSSHDICKACNREKKEQEDVKYGLVQMQSWSTLKR